VAIEPFTGQRQEKYARPNLPGVRGQPSHHRFAGAPAQISAAGRGNIYSSERGSIYKAW
jgi:hypothetical protein